MRKKKFEKKMKRSKQNKASKTSVVTMDPTSSLLLINY